MGLAQVASAKPYHVTNLALPPPKCTLAKGLFFSGAQNLASLKMATAGTLTL
jgi:hypothetical protein